MDLAQLNLPVTLSFVVPYLAVGYFCGAIPFGMIFSMLFCGIDPRKAGSCNVGATNIARLCGKKWGAVTLLCDACKGLLPILLVAGPGPYSGEQAILPVTIGIGAICGHMFSFFLKFKGGKGVATTVGVCLAIHPLSLIIAASCCLLVIWRTGFVSAGSLVLVSFLPPLLFFFGQPITALGTVLIAILVIVAHRENIKRLLSGTEKTWSPARNK